jgi:hypothetical protein
VESDELDARRDQALIDREQAATRVREAAFEAEHIAAARRAAESGDPAVVAAAAEDLHRVHALHEARQGHLERSRASLRRAAQAGRHLARLRRG